MPNTINVGDPIPDDASVGAQVGMVIPAGATVGGSGSNASSQPGAFQTKPGGPVYNANDLGSKPIDYPTLASAVSGAKARAALPDFPQQAAQSTGEAKAMLPAIGATAGAIGAPELLPLSSLLDGAAVVGAGAGLGTSAGQALAGQNPLQKQNLIQAGTNAGSTALTDLFFGAIPALSKTKIGRSFINESLGATPGGIAYGNPAKGLGDILDPFTGDIEKMKAALRAGASMNDAEIAAGGRLGAVSQKIQTLAPQLDSMVNASTKTVPVSDVIDGPLYDKLNEIITNPAVTPSDKIDMTAQLGGLQQSLKEGLGSDLSMADALRIKRAVGAEAGNWVTPPRNEIQEAYRDVYSSLKSAIHDNVPGAANVDEQLTDALAAQNSLQKLARGEEVSRGTGALRGTFGSNWIGRLESIVGRVLPATAQASKAVQPIATPAAAAAGAPIPRVQMLPLSSLLDPLMAQR